MDVGIVLLRGSTTDPGKEIFIGIAPRADAAAYLAGVQRTEIVDVRFDPFRALYRDVDGTKSRPIRHSRTSGPRLPRAPGSRN